MVFQAQGAYFTWNFVPLLICHPATYSNRRAVKNVSVVIEQAKCTFRHNTTRITYYHCRAEELMSISARLLFFQSLGNKMGNDIRVGFSKNHRIARVFVLRMCNFVTIIIYYCGNGHLSTQVLHLYL